MTPLNPWLTHVYEHPCQTVDSASRLSLIRESTDRDWLCRVVAWADHQQKSVTQAAERRLRALAREAAR